VQFTIGKETMTQRTEELKAQIEMETFATIDKNKAERYERQKVTFLEDRIKVLEKSIESIHMILGRYQMKEGE
jgi:hypothetical protein